MAAWNKQKNAGHLSVTRISPQATF
jgi:hypothetical protein